MVMCLLIVVFVCSIEGVVVALNSFLFVPSIIVVQALVMY